MNPSVADPSSPLEPTVPPVDHERPGGSPVAGVTGAVDHVAAAPDDTRRLDKKLFHSLAWSASSRWLMQLVTWGSTIVVTRLLSPSDYGLVGMATLYMGFVTMVSELGFGSAIVVLRGLSQEEIEQINTVSMLSGLCAFAISCAAAVPLGHYFRAPNLPPVVLVLATTFIITSLRAVPLALLQRDLEFKKTAARDAVGAFATAASAIVMAVAGWKYWAIAGSQVVGAVVLTAATLVIRRCGFRWPQWRKLGHVLRFSNRLVVGRLSWYVYSNADFFVAGRMLGQSALGGYTFAWTLTGLPGEKISSLIGSITPAFFSAVQDDKARLRRYLLVITEGLALATVPACIGIGLTARELVPAVFGKQWVSMIPAVQLLSVYAAIRSVRPLANNVLTVIGEMRFLMWQGIGSALVFPFAFWFASRWGPVGIAAAWAAIYPVQFGWGMTRLFRSGVVTLSEYARALWPAVSGTLVMSAGVLGFRALLPTTLPLMTRALAEVAVGAVVFAATTFALHRERVLRFVQVVRGVIAGRRQAGAAASSVPADAAAEGA